jgi:sugar porter (SP) family MFS transporter
MMTQMETPLSSNRNKNKIFTLFIIFSAGLGGILYGYDIGVISGALLFVQKTIPMSQSETGFIVGAVLMGGLVGTLITGPLADKFGRRTMILAACVIFIIGIILILTANSFVTLLAARLFLGVGVGVVAVAVPLYLTEIAPTKIRGRSVTIFQLLLTFGILLAYFVDLIFTPSGNWRGMFAVILIPAAVLFISMLFLPETPRWLLAKNRHAKAEKILGKIHHHSEIQNELAQIVNSFKKTASSSWKALFARNLWLPLFVALVIAACNQLTGINVLLQYAPIVIKEAGLDSNMGTMFSTVGIGLINFIGTILALFLIDHFGRKRLLVIGTLGIIIAYSYLALLPHFLVPGKFAAELTIAGFFAFIFFYSTGPGVVVWLAISELLPTKVRGQAVALCLFVNSLAGSLLATVFLPIEHKIGMSNTYWMLTIFTVVYFLTALFLLPETKGKTLEEIQESYNS